VKKLAVLFLTAAACGPGLVEFPTVSQGTGPGSIPGSPASCGAVPGLVYCGGATCDTLGTLHCGLNNGVCEACPGGYSCSSGVCAPPTTCAKGQVLGVSSCVNASVVVAGGNTSCAIVSEGGTSGVYCWGANDSGQLGPSGQGLGASSGTPTEIAALRGASAVAVGAAHVCAIASDGTVKCWGRNDAGQLGVSTSGTPSADPVAVPNVSNATAIAAGDRHSCAITPAGALCWGAIAGNFPQAKGATKIVAGDAHTCAMLSSSVLCWGKNDFGQLGNGTQTDSSSPVTPLTGAMQDVTAGLHHTCALLSAGVDRTNALRCWGGNELGQIDANSVPGPNRLTPTNVVAFGSNQLPDHVAAGRAHTCVLRSPSDLACFGDSTSGQLAFPVATVNSLAAGGNHSCLVDASSLLHCWGSNASNELGPFGP